VVPTLWFSSEFGHIFLWISGFVKACGLLDFGLVLFESFFFFYKTPRLHHLLGIQYQQKTQMKQKEMYHKTRTGKHSKIIQTMMEYRHCVCLTRHTAPPNGVGQTEIKTDYKKVLQ